MAVNINVPSQVKTYANLAAFPATGALKTIYIAEDTNKTYRWTGSVYVEVSASAASGITIGSTAIASGTVGRILFEGAGNVVQESSSLFWDNTNGRLGIGTSTPSAIIHSVGSVTASGSIARGNFFNNALVASANNDVLVGLDIQPTFTNGAFTGLENIPLRFVSQSNSNVVKNILLKNIGTGNGTGVSIGFNNLNANNLSHAFIKSYYVTPSGMAMSFGTGGGSSLTSEGTTALVLNADQTANFTARVIANSGGFQATGTTTNLLMSDNGTPVITRNGSTGIQFLKDAYWQTFSIFTNNTEKLRVASTGNVLINTTTDAGFRLDVNGTARFNGNLTFQTTSWILDNSNAIMHRGGFNVESIAFNLSRMVFTDNNGFVFNGNNSAATLTASSIVDIQSTTKGFLPPRMTTTQKNAIASPAAGLVVYDTTLNKLCVYTTTWETVTSL